MSTTTTNNNNPSPPNGEHKTEATTTTLNEQLSKLDDIEGVKYLLNVLAGDEYNNKINDVIKRSTVIGNLYLYQPNFQTLRNVNDISNTLSKQMEEHNTIVFKIGEHLKSVEMKLMEAGKSLYGKTNTVRRNKKNSTSKAVRDADKAQFYKLFMRCCDKLIKDGCKDEMLKKIMQSESKELILARPDMALEILGKSGANVSDMPEEYFELYSAEMNPLPTTKEVQSEPSTATTK